jgi:hypothetical protein
MRNTYKIVIGRPEENRPLEPRRRWENNIKMDLKKQGARVKDWIQVAQSRVT